MVRGESCCAPVNRSPSSELIHRISIHGRSYRFAQRVVRREPKSRFVAADYGLLRRPPHELHGGRGGRFGIRQVELGLPVRCLGGREYLLRQT